MLTKSNPEEAKHLLREAQEDVNRRWRLYEYLSTYKREQPKEAPKEPEKVAETNNDKRPKP